MSFFVQILDEKQKRQVKHNRRQECISSFNGWNKNYLILALFSHISKNRFSVAVGERGIVISYSISSWPFKMYSCITKPNLKKIGHSYPKKLKKSLLGFLSIVSKVNLSDKNRIEKKKQLFYFSLGKPTMWNIFHQFHY